VAAMADTPPWFDETLSRQLAMNPQTWAMLQEHGVDESTELTLDFFYDAPGEAEAQALATFLCEETDYDVAVDANKKRMLSKKEWSVTGSTQPTKASAEILDQWVRWMVTAGAENGGCEFDGWGAKVP
jgi:hypothetical protein